MTRLARAFLGLVWVIWLVVAVTDSNAAKAGEQLFYMLLFTAGYMVSCKAIAWVYNGFFPKQE
jgi:hypothetical protein